MANPDARRPTQSALSRFVAERASKLRLISSHSRGEVTVGELESEAWLIAVEIGDTRGYAVDLEDPDDQEQILARLYNRFVKYTEKKVRNAVKLHPDGDEGSGKDWLHAPLSSDPLVVMIEREETSEHWNVSKRFGYSQAAVYTFLIVRLGRTDAAAYLVVSRETFAQRMRRFVEHVKVQPSLFDRTEYIDPDFVPMPGVPRVTRKRSDIAARQFSIRLNRMSEVRYRLSRAYKRLVAFMSRIRVQPA